MWFLNRSNTNRPVQLQKQARSLKFWSIVEEELYCPSFVLSVPLFSPMQIVGFPTGQLICVLLILLELLLFGCHGILILGKSPTKWR